MAQEASHARLSCNRLTWRAGTGWCRWILRRRADVEEEEEEHHQCARTFHPCNHVGKSDRDAVLGAESHWHPKQLNGHSKAGPEAA